MGSRSQSPSQSEGQRMNNKARAGSIGGNVTLERYGVNYYSEIGKLGGRPRLLTISELRQQSASRQIKEGGNGDNLHKGGSPIGVMKLTKTPLNNLSLLRELWLQGQGRARDLITGENEVGHSPQGS